MLLATRDERAITTSDPKPMPRMPLGVKSQLVCTVFAVGEESTCGEIHGQNYSPALGASCCSLLAWGWGVGLCCVVVWYGCPLVVRSPFVLNIRTKKRGRRGRFPGVSLGCVFGWWWFSLTDHSV